MRLLGRRHRPRRRPDQRQQQQRREDQHREDQEDLVPRASPPAAPRPAAGRPPARRTRPRWRFRAPSTACRAPPRGRRSRGSPRSRYRRFRSPRGSRASAARRARPHAPTTPALAHRRPPRERWRDDRRTARRCAAKSGCPNPQARFWIAMASENSDARPAEMLGDGDLENPEARPDPEAHQENRRSPQSGSASGRWGLASGMAALRLDRAESEARGGRGVKGHFVTPIHRRQ